MGFVLSGFLHWIDWSRVLIFAFDLESEDFQGDDVHPFCDHFCGGRAKFPTTLRTIDWSASQLSLVYERATTSNEDSSRLILE
ncbi:unnamed protein product [Prunus armeniaca]